MTIYAGIDLKKWRESQKMSAADLAERVSCDTTTIYRYESGKLKPDPDVMYEICDALGDTDVWTSWMRSEYPKSYGRVHPETPQLNLQGALMSMYAEVADVEKLQLDAMRDGADGRIDNANLSHTLQKEITEMVQCAQRVRSLLRSETDG